MLMEFAVPLGSSVTGAPNFASSMENWSAPLGTLPPRAETTPMNDTASPKMEGFVAELTLVVVTRAIAAFLARAKGESDVSWMLQMRWFSGSG